MLGKDTNQDDRRLEKGRQTKEQILAAAEIIIIDEGMEALSASRIASGAGISKSALFHHFPSIETIPLEIFKRQTYDFFSSLDLSRIHSGEDYLRELGRLLFASSGETRKMFFIYIASYQAALHDASLRRIVNESVGHCAGAILQGLEAFRKKPIPEKIRSKAELMILAMMDGLVLHLLLGRSGEEALATWMDFASLFCTLIS